MMDFMELSRETTRLRNEDQYLEKEQMDQKSFKKTKEEKKGHHHDVVLAVVTFSKQHTIFQTFFPTLGSKASKKKKRVSDLALSSKDFSFFPKSLRKEPEGKRRNKAVVTCFEKNFCTKKVPSRKRH